MPKAAKLNATERATLRRVWNLNQQIKDLQYERNTLLDPLVIKHGKAPIDLTYAGNDY